MPPGAGHRYSRVHEGELVRVTAEVDPYLEVTEIVDRTVKAGGPALLFENVKGARHPLLINQFGTERRMCLGFGVARSRRAGLAGTAGEGAPHACPRRGHHHQFVCDPREPCVHLHPR